MKKVLIFGESYFGYTVHIKGADTMESTSYIENVKWLKAAVEAGGHDVTYIPSHMALADFPDTVERLSEYDLVIISDVGANTLMLTNKSFKQGTPAPDRCSAIRDYVLAGGSFLMIGGFMSFTGIEGKARYGVTPIADILPVELLPYDDRMECSCGVTPEIREPEHPIFSGISGNWPHFIGYNKTLPKSENCKLLATCNGDPFIAAGEFGSGRSAVFTSDCAPHWGSPAFLAWDHYTRIWNNLIAWLTKETNA